MATYTTGTTLTFDSDDYTVTNITYSLTDTAADGDVIDVSHLGLAQGADALTMNRPLKPATTGGDTGVEVQIEYLGTAPIAAGTEGPLVISGAISLNRNARCTASSVTLAVNDVVRGSATFRVDAA